MKALLKPYQRKIYPLKISSYTCSSYKNSSTFDTFLSKESSVPLNKHLKHCALFLYVIAIAIQRALGGSLCCIYSIQTGSSAYCFAQDGTDTGTN